jgi:hypothetical protein
MIDPINPPRSYEMIRTLIALPLAALLTACGGGADVSTPEDVYCNPDSLDCAAMYVGVPYVFVPTSAAGANIYSYDATPRAGYQLVNGK